jgi:hypothetical protein
MARSRGLGDVYKRQTSLMATAAIAHTHLKLFALPQKQVQM